MNIFPVLAGIGWPVTVAPIWNAQIQKTVTGRVVAATYQQYPLYKFTVQFNVLLADDFNTLLAFFNQQQGNVVPFWFWAGPGQDTVSGQAIGTGDGSTTTFNFLRSYGGFSEPVGAINGTPSVYLNGYSINSGALTAPNVAPTLSQVNGGTSAATTYYVKTTYANPGGDGETTVSIEASLAVSADYLLNVASPPPQSGAYYYNVYVGTTSGGETLQATVAVGTAWTMPTSGLVSGRAMPSANTTGWALNNSAGPASISFNAAPASGVVISWSGSYYFQCRFSKGTAALEQFMAQLYKTKTIDLETYW
ncbi:MAG: DUF2460 domain-containing protein [Steroidobacteraceae bacterium]